MHPFHPDRQEPAEKTEHLPSYNLVKWGDILALSCNEQFAKRFYNILAECVKDGKLTEMLTDVQRHFAYCLNMAGGKRLEPNPHVSKIDIRKFEYVYTLTFGREFGMPLNNMLAEFLETHQVSPPLFSFCKQLDNCLNPKRRGTGYADD